MIWILDIQMWAARNHLSGNGMEGGERPRLGIRAQSSTPWPLLSHVTLIKFITPVYFSVLKNKMGIIRGLIRRIA